jgi:hypothetical protein
MIQLQRDIGIGKGLQFNTNKKVSSKHVIQLLHAYAFRQTMLKN